VNSGVDAARGAPAEPRIREPDRTMSADPNSTATSPSGADSISGTPAGAAASAQAPTGGWRSRALLSRHESRLLLVDVQEKLLAVIPGAADLVANCRRLLQAARLLGVMIDATEQYPRGLGPTESTLIELLGPRPEKLAFSACGCLPWAHPLSSERPRQVVLAGLETHVCILQTALNLIAFGCDVFLPVDALSSRRPLDHEVALRRLANEGATITTTEAVLFEWCERAGTDEFKQISRLVTGR
jgi:nicotinamidase-related amidase